MDVKRINSTERHLVVDLFNTYRVFYNQPSDKTLADNYIRERLENNESIIFVAIEQEGNKEVPVGFTQLYPQYSSLRATKNWVLNDLFVDQNHRRKGVGEKLVRKAMKFAKDNKASFVQLETGIDNYTAQRLYETIGFIKQEPDADFFVYRISVN